VPWNASKIDLPFVFFDRAPEAPPPVFSNDQVSSIRSKPIRDLGIQDAYVAALERDTLEGYLDFLAAYPGDPMAPRVRAIVAARREAITWRHTRVIDTPQAYWSYLRRYPRGPHVADAHRRLAYLAAAFEPPPSFAAITYDVPPPLEEEVVYFRRPLLVFDDPDYGFIPPPPPPIFFLPPPPPEFVVLAPPPPAFGLFVLPVPDFVPVPAYYNPPVMWRRRRRISFTTTFTTRSSSTTRAIPSPSPTRAVRRRRSRLLRRSRLKLLPRQPNQRRLPLRRRPLAARPFPLAPLRCRQAPQRLWEQPQVPLSWRRRCLLR